MSRKQKRDVKIAAKQQVLQSNANRTLAQVGRAGVQVQVWPVTSDASDKVNSKQKALHRGGQFVLPGISRFQKHCSKTRGIKL